MRGLMFCILLVSSTPLLAGPKEGKWEYTSEMNVPGMQQTPKLPDNVKLPPGVQMPKMGPNGMIHTFTQCVAKEDWVPREQKGAEQCKLTQQERSGDTVKWETVCATPQGRMTGQGVATYKGTTMNATMKMTAAGRDGFAMTQKISGRYLGPCHSADSAKRK